MPKPENRDNYPLNKKEPDPPMGLVYAGPAQMMMTYAGPNMPPNGALNGMMFFQQSQQQTQQPPEPQEEQERIGFCRQCGSPLYVKSKFCPNCGSELTWE